MNMGKSLSYLDILGSGEFTIFCGAGISWNSGLPLANEVKEYILKKLPVYKEGIYEIMKSNLPFEAFIESLSENTDISQILDMFEDGTPTTNHILIARLAKHGYIKTIFTTNFDLLIEKALEKEGLERNKDFEVYYDEGQFLKIDFKNIDDRVIRIFKIHGSVEDKKSIRTTLKAIASKTLSNQRMNLIRYLFSTGRHKKVLILGYSCSDEFDITPQIKSIEGNQKEIVFVEHSNKEEIEDVKAKDYKNPFKKFPGKRIKCNTDKFIERFWGSLEGIIGGEYKLIKSDAKWGKYVDKWAICLEKNNGDISYFISGSIFYLISNFKMAIEYHEKSLEIAKSIGDKTVESACYVNLGSTYDSLSDFKMAIEYHEKSLEIAKSIGDKTVESACYANLANAYYNLGDFKRVIEYFEKSLEINKKNWDKVGEARCYTGLGYAYYSLGDFNRAIEYYEGSLEIAKVTGDKKEEARCYTGLGNAYSSLGNFEGAIVHYEKSLGIYEGIGNRAGEPKCFTGLGYAYSSLGDFKGAIEYYKKSLEITKEIGNKVEESICNTGLGIAYRSLGDFNRAIEYYEKSLEIAKAVGNKAVESACYANLGSAYDSLEDFKMAIMYFLSAEKIFCETRQIYHLTGIYHNLSLAYQKIGDYANAEKYKKKLEQIQK